MSEDLFLRAATGALFFAGIVTSSVYRARAHRRGGALPAEPRPRPSVAFRLVFGVGVWLLLLVQMVAPGWVPWSFLPLPNAIRWLGLAVLALMPAAIWWTMRSIGAAVSPSTATRAGAQLVTAGPYRWIRHPIYTFGFVTFLGAALALQSIPALVLLVLMLGWLPRRVRSEERNLVASYGEAYRAYMARTGRFLPRLSSG